MRSTIAGKASPVFAAADAEHVGNGAWVALPDNPREVPEGRWTAIFVNDLTAVSSWARAARGAGRTWLPLRWREGVLAAGPLFPHDQAGCLTCLQYRENQLDGRLVRWPVSIAQFESVWPHVTDFLDRQGPRSRIIDLFDGGGSLGMSNYLAPWPECPDCGSGVPAPRQPVVRRGLSVAALDGGWRVTEPGATLRSIERHVGALCGQAGWLRARKLTGWPRETWLAAAPAPHPEEQPRIFRGYGGTPEQAMISALGRVFERIMTCGGMPPIVNAGVWVEEALLQALCHRAAEQVVRDPAGSPVVWETASSDFDGWQIEKGCWEERLFFARAIRADREQVVVYPQASIVDCRLERLLWDADHGEAAVDDRATRWLGLHEIGGNRPLPAVFDVGLIDDAIDALGEWFEEAGSPVVWQDVSRPDIPLAMARVE